MSSEFNNSILNSNPNFQNQNCSTKNSLIPAGDSNNCANITIVSNSVVIKNITLTEEEKKIYKTLFEKPEEPSNEFEKKLYENNIIINDQLLIFNLKNLLSSKNQLHGIFTYGAFYKNFF